MLLAEAPFLRGESGSVDKRVGGRRRYRDWSEGEWERGKDEEQGQERGVSLRGGSTGLERGVRREEEGKEGKDGREEGE